MSGKYTLHPVGGNEYHWELKARDAQTMLSSKVYSARAGAESGIESCRINSALDERYERLAVQGTRSYFVLREENGDILGTSQTYPTDIAREKGIASCKESGPLATTTYAPVR